MATREGWTRKYVDAKKAERSYRPKAGTMSPSLKRARAPFLVQNAITGIFLATFTVGVYLYSIHAVKQDEFDDVDNVVKSRARDMARASAANLTASEESEIMEAAIRNVQARKT